jgi:hypothetical protein
VSELSSAKLPGFAVSVELGSAWRNGWTLQPLLSFSFRNFKQEGNLSSGTYSQKVETTIPFFSAGLGVEWGYPNIGSSHVRPFWGLALRPHMLVYSPSPFDEGGVRGGYSAQTSVGLEYSPWGENNLGIDLAFLMDFGSVDGQQLQAMAVQGGVRWSL